MATETESPYFRASIVQYMLPDGRKVNKETDLPILFEPLYRDMLDHGCRFEAEVLTTDQVSVTIFDPETEDDIDISIVKNGPAVQECMLAMLDRALWKN
jgi:hypothetical protein